MRDLTSEAASEEVLRGEIIEALGSGQRSCFSCLRCTSGCTSMKLLELRPHFIMNMVKLGLVEELISSGIIWTCALCLKCEERCPQETSPHDLITLLRTLSFKREENVPEAYLRVFGSLLETGFIQEPMVVVSREFEEFTRESLGLPEIKGPGAALSENLIELMSKGAA